MLKTVLILIAFHLVSLAAFAAEPKNSKGLLPEVRLKTNSEDENERKALTSELMITRSENKAISSLQAIVKKKKGTKEEPDLWYRLGELYMRRSKSGRFFDLHRNTPLMKLSPFPVPNEKGAVAIKRAINIYNKMEQDFPKFQYMDEVLFNNAFAHQQIGRLAQSVALYEKLLTKYPKSPLIPDGTLALGELLYDQGKFQPALERFLQIENYPKSRVYSYGMYKAAWSYYNLRDGERAVKKLVQVVKTNPPLRNGEVPSNRHNLRREALRDLTVFVSDSVPANQLYSFFEDVTSGEELGQAITDLSKIFEAHSRQKDMNIVLGEYIKRNPIGPDVVKSHLALIGANEDLKKRDLVIEHMQMANDLCKVNSPWRAEQDIGVVEASCVEGYRRVSLEITKKWWEIWLKNKKNPEFSELTQKLFKLMLDNEDPTKPDLKTRYAYAELLFQMDKFDEASAQYKIVGEKTTEATLRHDADYAALFSKEKSIEKGKSPLKEAERKDLATNYLTKHPNGKQSTSVRFKLGHIAYEEGNYEESEKYLKPLIGIKGKEYAEIKRKSEDLILDILNIRKDYAGIKTFSKQILAGSSDQTRNKGLNKILEEAHFTEIQEFAKTGDKDQASDKLIAFANEHQDSKLSKDALWQALSILYTEGKVYDAAELSLKYIKKYPGDKRNVDALKDAAKAYADVGQIGKSAETLAKLAELEPKNKATHLELAADIYLLEKRIKEARAAYNGILVSADQKTLERIYGKLLDSYKNNPNGAELDALQNKILAKGIEPYTTQIMIARAQALLSKGKQKEAFDLSMKANGRSVSAEIRAEARLIQAQVLESELVRQSVKARMDKFAMVLGMKTEKLDKAHTAYLSALKMSNDAFQQLEAMRGIDRCYGNYIESLQTMPLPDGLSNEEQEVLRGELAKLTSPIQSKKNENEAKLKVLAAAKGQSAATERTYANLGPEQTVTPIAIYPSGDQMKAFLPKTSDMTIGRVSRFETRSPKACPKAAILAEKWDKESPLEIAGNCFSSRQYDMVEKVGLALAKKKETRALGLFYASVGAEAGGFSDKSLWMIEASLKLEPESAPYVYQKARLVYKADGLTAALPFFEKVLNMQLPANEMTAFAAVKSFSEGDFTSAAEKFSALSKEEMYNLEVGAMLSESLAQKGEVEKALGIVKNFIVLKRGNVDYLLQEAHLLETFKGNPTAALGTYEKAYRATSETDLRGWLDKKIKYLKNSNKVGQHVISGDL